MDSSNLMDFSLQEDEENQFRVPPLAQTPVVKNSILKPSTKDNLIQLSTPMHKNLKVSTYLLSILNTSLLFLLGTHVSSTNKIDCNGNRVLTTFKLEGEVTSLSVSSHGEAVLKMKIWIYWSESNSWIYFIYISKSKLKNLLVRTKFY